MQLSFAQVEGALAGAHSISADRRSAFRHRLKHVQRLNFLPGINTGRGRAATYSASDLFLLGVVLELNQLGLTPERAIGVVQDDMHAVAMAAHMAASKGVPPALTETAQGESTRIENPIFLYCDPHNLNDLTDPPDQVDWASQTFFYAGLGQILESFREWFTHGVPRMSFFSVSTLLARLAIWLPSTTEERMSDFYAAVAAWADPIIHAQED
ncbi:hypothetical protein OMW55_01510 [Sphingomonas sp. BN140010]|uniref:HTH merR-type domain-containing protein n=1 Tax=Sphingomonas arvum TaxID=2992113 RepID=A0ABT3JBN5_9SPHN|nr:hypothetical protein [Sphingomonas sp. BN140010]MCW3796487.1 hypothetical protein [Sphingomonas sp. BN140010]